MIERTRKVRNDKWEPTDKELDRIEMLAGIGMSIEDIGYIIGVSKSTMHRHMRGDSIIRDTMDSGKAKAKAKISGTAFKMADSGKQPSMTQFWLKARAGWRDDVPAEDKFDAPPKDPSLDD